MTEDVAKMAREAGYGDAMADLHAPALDRFAALVRADEREADALLCEQLGAEGYGSLAIAAAIRLRGKT
jgi:hypothetical protein